MARKANISREEIHQACWNLLEQNYFPNIPRVAEYFSTLDGRKCSNTTLLNSISEWELIYKEQQQVKFNDLGEAVKPVFKKLEREFIQVLQSQLDDKIGEFEHAEKLKSDSTNGHYLSLSAALSEQEQELADSQNKAHTMEQERVSVSSKLDYMKQRYEDTLSTLHVTNENMLHLEEQLKESQLNLVQKEIDMVKAESAYQAIENENRRLIRQTEQQKNEIEKLRETVLTLQQHNDANIINVLSAKIDSLNKVTQKKQ
ncbi:hypothetical protein [Marinomonas sp. 2405UD68-3]|uniref:hypothetical protein n=1 Tax=Marinomonas sp. 2405UD68-3 TaxID=3391835 RepID=UPI0039C931B0